jgi:hypothetical protein
MRHSFFILYAAGGCGDSVRVASAGDSAHVPAAGSRRARSRGPDVC